MRIIEEDFKEADSLCPGDVVALAVDGMEIPVKIKEYDDMGCLNKTCPIARHGCWRWVGDFMCCDVLEDAVE